MKIDKFAKMISKMPKFLSYIILAFYVILRPKKADRLIESMEKAVEVQDNEVARHIEEIKNELVAIRIGKP